MNAPVDAVFAIVTNNQEWHYRSSLDDLEIICTQGDIEEWEETANSVTIRFKTLEKRPHSFYSFEMDSKCSQGSGKQYLNRWKEVKPYSLQQKR
ncbi:SRPBCC family protein [Porphyromonas gingivalis]|uniref:SRPBCC family protein n=1 Tax=Porphyromonas gingivalis TaxID=837 RepID=UPI00211876F5|nr:SRPBCC family protein [Porphyromonas gingivalis]